MKTWFGHPGGLLVLFLTEMWERFSFYGMRAILQLFLTAPLAVGGFAMAEADACGNALNTWVTPLVTRMPEKVYYGVIGIFAILVGMAFWAASRKLTRLTGAVH